MHRISRSVLLSLVVCCLLGCDKQPTQSTIESFSWEARNIGTTLNLNAVAASDSFLVALGESGTIYTSTDANTWTMRHRTNGFLHGVVRSSNKWVAVGDSILTSSDGLDWTNSDPTRSHWLNDIAWNGIQFVAVGRSEITISGNGRNWVTVYPPSLPNFFELNAIVWSGAKLVAVGDSVKSSVDAVQWGSVSTGHSAVLSDVSWASSMFLAVGKNGAILTSFDGDSWESSVSSTVVDLNAIAWSGRTFVAVGNGGVILTSLNTVYWRQEPPVTLENLNDLIWTGKQFLIVGDHGTILVSKTQ